MEAWSAKYYEIIMGVGFKILYYYVVCGSLLGGFLKNDDHIAVGVNVFFYFDNFNYLHQIYAVAL